uniref:Uncharacterized protein n=1 Tax=Picea sitchensis TaxID=3332 RepID=A9NXF1_PICSI|nr:unknown [Picea sitchensis]
MLGSLQTESRSIKSSTGSASPGHCRLRSRARFHLFCPRSLPYHA